MKKLYTLLLVLFTMTSTACGGSGDDELSETTKKPEVITIKTSQSLINVPAKGGSYSINIETTGEKWTASSTLDWLTLTTIGTSTSKGSINVNIGANSGDARSATIIVNSGSESEKITIEQGAVFKVSKSEVMTKSGGEECSIVISGRKEWTASSDQSWVTVEKINDSSLSIKTSKSSVKATRSAKITIKSGDEEKSVTVRQESIEDTDLVEKAGYELVWNDEFNQGTELNKTDWIHEVKPSGWVNNERQNYVDGEINGQRVTELSDGKLRINCLKSGGNVYSGRVYAHVDKGWKYGYVEARMMLPKGKGTWPAFWMMPTDFKSWPDDGEIDIMEEVGYRPGYVSSSIHCKSYYHSIGTQKTGEQYIADCSDEFHIYALEWTEDYIKGFVDGKCHFTFENDQKGDKNTWPFNTSFYVIFNLAWGGDWGGAQGLDETALPATFVIDYVRVYQKK